MLGSTKGVSLRLVGSFSATQKRVLRCVATNTLFVPEHYTPTGHGRQTTGPFHTSCISHRGHRLSWFSLSYTAWLEVASHIAPLSQLSCASVPPAILSSRKRTHRQVFLSSQRTVISFPCHFFSLASSKRLLCTAFFAYTPIFRPSITSPSSVLPDGSGNPSSSFIPSSSANYYY